MQQRLLQSRVQRWQHLQRSTLLGDSSGGAAWEDKLDRPASSGAIADAGGQFRKIAVPGEGEGGQRARGEGIDITQEPAGRSRQSESARGLLTRAQSERGDREVAVGDSFRRVDVGPGTDEGEEKGVACSESSSW